MEPLEFFVIDVQGIKHPILLHCDDNLIEIISVEQGVSFTVEAWDDVLEEMGLTIVDTNDNSYTVSELIADWDK